MPGHTAVDTASVARSDFDEERRWWILAHRSGSLSGRAHRREDRAGSRLRLTRRGWPGLVPFVAAQLVVLPGALIWLYRRSPALYRQLRDTVIATWLIAVPIFALFPWRPRGLAGAGISERHRPRPDRADPTTSSTSPPACSSPVSASGPAA
jgi:hypothetical protein